MSNFDSPRVRVTEVRKGPTSIKGKGATIGGFAGTSHKGPTNTATLVTSFDEFTAIFGSYKSGSFLAYAVYLFFLNGGERCYVVRIIGDTPVKALVSLVNGTGAIIDATASSFGAWANGYTITSVRKDVVVTQVPAAASLGSGAITFLDVVSASRIRIGDTVKVSSTDVLETDTLRVIVTGVNGNRISFASTSPSAAITVGTPSDANVTIELLDLTVKDLSGLVVARFQNLRMSALSVDNYFLNVINGTFQTPITVAAMAPGAAAADVRPTDGIYVLTTGADGAAPTDNQYIGGGAGTGTGLNAFDRTNDMDMLSVPGVFGTSQAVTKALIDYADLRKTIMAVLEIPSGKSRSQAVTHATVDVNTPSTYAEGFWYPWLVVLDPLTGARLTVPPSGARQGVIARVHGARGDAKAPAGIEDGQIAGIIDVESRVSEIDYDVLYPNRINAIQVFDGQGTAFMGNITLDPTGEVIESGIRLYLLKTRKALEAGLRWVNFEPNNATTRGRVVRNVTSFLTGHWQKGLLVGAKAADAFFVVCNDTNNGPTVQAARKLNIRIGVAVVHAAEFVDITIEQDTRALDAAQARGV